MNKNTYVIEGNVFLKHLMFWYNKTDDECIEMATVNYPQAKDLWASEDKLFF